MLPLGNVEVVYYLTICSENNTFNQILFLALMALFKSHLFENWVSLNSVLRQCAKTAKLMILHGLSWSWHSRGLVGRPAKLQTWEIYDVHSNCLESAFGRGRICCRINLTDKRRWNSSSRTCCSQFPEPEYPATQSFLRGTNSAKVIVYYFRNTVQYIFKVLRKTKYLVRKLIWRN